MERIISAVLWCLPALASMPRCGAAEAVDPSQIHFTVEAIRSGVDLRSWDGVQLDGKMQDSVRRSRDPQQLWHAGVEVMLAIPPVPGWLILSADQAAGAATTDSGSSIVTDPFPMDIAAMQHRGNLMGRLSGNRSDPQGKQEFVLQLLPPDKPSGRLSELRGHVRLVLVSTVHTQRIHLVPVAGTMQRIAGIPECDLELGLSGDGKLLCDYTVGRTERCKAISCLAADGSAAAALQLSGRSSMNREHDEAGFTKPPAAVDLEFYGPPFAIEVDFTLQNLSLTGTAPPSTLVVGSACRPAALPEAYAPAPDLASPPPPAAPGGAAPGPASAAKPGAPAQKSDF